jgi:hypothetical protein
MATCMWVSQGHICDQLRGQAGSFLLNLLAPAKLSVNDAVQMYELEAVKDVLHTHCLPSKTCCC